MASENVDVTLTLKGRQRFSGEARGAASDLRQVADAADAGSRSGGRFRSAFSTVGPALATVARAGALAATGIGLAGAGLIKAGSDANEASSAFGTVFKTFSSDATAALRDVQKVTGQNTAELQTAFTQFGAFARGAGVADDQLTTFSRDLVGAAGDIASFNNADPTEVLAALQSGLSGEVEPLRRFRIFMSDAALSAKSAEMGFGDTFSTLAEGEKVMVRQAFIMANLGDQAGDLARTADAPANAFRYLVGRAQEAATMLGTGLLPGVAVLTPRLRELADSGIAALTGRLPDITAFAEQAGSRILGLVDQARLAINRLRSGDVAGAAGGFLTDQLGLDPGSVESALSTVRDIVAKVQGVVASFRSGGGVAGAGTAAVAFLGIDPAMVRQASDVVRTALTTVRTAVTTVWAQISAAFSASSTGDAAASLQQLGVGLGGAFKAGLAAAQAALPLVSEGLRWAGENASWLAPMVVRIAFGLLALKSAGAGVNAALAPIGGLAGATKGAELATAGLNTARQVASFLTARMIGQTATLTATTAAGTTVQVTANSAQRVGLFTTVRTTAAKLASAAASVAVRGATLAWTGAQWLLNAAFAASPIGAVIAIIAGLVGAVVWAYNNVDWFRSAVDRAWQALRNGFAVAVDWVRGRVEALRPVLTAVGAFLSGPLSAALTTAQGNLQRVRDAAQWVKDKFDLARAGAQLVAGYLAGAFATGMESARGVVDRVRGVVETLGDKWTTVKDAFSGFVDRFTSFELPGWVQTLIDSAGSIGSSIGGWFSGGAGDGPGMPISLGGGGGGAAMPLRENAGYRAQTAALMGSGLPAQVTSGSRPGAITATGNPSYHGKGRAVDMQGANGVGAPNPQLLAINRWIAANYAPWTKELIYSGPGAIEINNGRPHDYTGVTRANHFDHVHWAMAQGAYVPAQPGGVHAVVGEGRDAEFVTPDPMLRSAVREEVAGVMDRMRAAGVAIQQLTINADSATDGRRVAREFLEGLDAAVTREAVW